MIPRIIFFMSLAFLVACGDKDDTGTEGTADTAAE